LFLKACDVFDALAESGILGYGMLVAKKEP
jgi:hypothetical protein